METQEENDGRKKLLLKASELILKMSQRSLNIIKERKMYHTKLIERSSRCTKDPNPLSTAMILLNQKFPIAISRPAAIKYKIPKSQLCQTDRSDFIEDSHKHSKILARLNTIDWWITHSPDPPPNLNRLTDVLFRRADEECEKYFSVNWSQTRLQWGIPTLQRSLVRTCKPIMDVPSGLRTAAIKEIFFPEQTIPNHRMPTGILAELKEKIGVVLEDNLPLTKQITIIVNSLDPRERYLPILPTCGEDTIQIKHAVVHNNLVVINYIQDVSHDSNMWAKSFKNLVSSIIYEGKASRIPIEELKEICLRSQVSGLDFLTMVDSIKKSDSLYLLWVKALFERPTTLEYSIGPLTLCPDPREGREVVMYNKKSLSRVMKMGNQIVNFKYLGMRGKFTYNGQVLIEIVSNYTSNRDLLSLLKEVAKYIGYRFQDTNSLRAQVNDRTIESFVDYSPHKFLDCSITRFSTIGLLNSGENCGKFRNQPNSEYMTSGCYSLTLDENLNILLPGTALKIVVDIPKSELRPFSDEVICRHYRMIRCYNIKEMIKEMFYYYLRNSDETLNRIQDRDFVWKNYYLRKYLGAAGRQISYMARNIAIRLTECDAPNKQYLCFVYCFCNTDPKHVGHGPLSYVLPDGTIIDFAADKGIFVYSTQYSSYLLYGMKVGKMARKIGKAELLRGVLEGYKINYPALDNRKLTSVRYLETQSSTIEEGSSYNAYVGGVLYTFTRDSSISYGMSSTVNRHMSDVVRRIESQGKRIVLGKRWLEGEESGSETDEPERKKAKMDSKQITFEYDDEIVVGGGYVSESETMDVGDSEEDI